ncbi:hypothetical protein L5D93_12835 [Paenibacillus thiaminolyticus]|nr:hypothetical protein [Paenibacillus thiaminolyticus]
MARHRLRMGKSVQPHRQQLTHPVRRSTMAGEASTPPAGGGAIFEDSGWNYL